MFEVLHEGKLNIHQTLLRGRDSALAEFDYMQSH